LQTFTVTITRTDAPLGQWVSGHLTLTGGGHTVRSPIAVQPVTVSTPSEVHADASASGSKSFSTGSPTSSSDLTTWRTPTSPPACR